MWDQELIAQRQAVIDKLNGTSLPAYFHDFEPVNGSCRKCRRLLIDEARVGSDGNYSLNMFCPVIGWEEFARFFQADE